MRLWDTSESNTGTSVGKSAEDRFVSAQEINHFSPRVAVGEADIAANANQVRENHCPVSDQLVAYGFRADGGSWRVVIARQGLHLAALAPDAARKLAGELLTHAYVCEAGNDGRDPLA